MKTKYIIPAVAVALLFASTAEAGPVRNLLGKLKGKPRAAVGKVVNVAKSPLKCLGGRCGK